VSCPDIDRLIDFRVGQRPDPELEAHLEGCPSCRADLRIIQRIPASLRSEIEVPERLIQRVLSELPEPDRSPESRQLPVAQVLITGLLGSLTAMTAVVAAESVGTGDLFELLWFSIGVGAVSVVLQIRTGSKARPAAT